MTWLGPVSGTARCEAGSGPSPATVLAVALCPVLLALSLCVVLLITNPPQVLLPRWFKESYPQRGWGR